MNRLHAQKEAGFSLIEVMVALVVFTIGILSVALMQISALRGNSVSNDWSKATTFASDVIEQMQYWDYDDDQLDSSNNISYTLPDGTVFTADGNLADDDDDFQAYWEINDDDPVSGSKTIDVTVCWIQQDEMKNFSLSTIKAEVD